VGHQSAILETTINERRPKPTTKTEGQQDLTEGEAASFHAATTRIQPQTKWPPSLATARFLMIRGGNRRYSLPALASITAKIPRIELPREGSDRCPYRSLNTPGGLVAVSRGPKGDASRREM
jgi:hypothetical protein